MGGAFVAVADDATATHWNPAGLVAGGPAGLTIGLHRFHVGDQAEAPAAGRGRGKTTLTSLGTWPLGVSYGSFERSRARLGPADGLEVERLRVNHVGVTVLQSVIEGLVVGTTLRVLRGDVTTTASSGASATLDELLDTADEVSGERQTRVDADLGIMATSDTVRIGLTWRNLRSPSFDAPTGTRATLPRQARLGAAVLPTAGVTLAFDVDLNTVDLMGDLRRMCALGGEAQLGSRLVVRTGVRWNLAVSSGPIGAVGASIGVRRGLWLDAHFSSGGTDKAREVGAALRAGV
jgi:hypothetical protein